MLQALLEHLQWISVVNLQKIEGSGTAIKSLGVLWSGRTCIVLESVIDKVQAYPILKKMKEM